MSAFLSLLCSLIFSNAFFVSVAEAALKNITIPLPEGTSDHGDPGLVCTPTKWTDLFTFFLGNFATHVATIKFLPGERNIDMIPALALSLLFPAFGVFRGIMNILTAPISAKKQGPHQMAVRARALCMVVRGPNWKPMPGDEVQDVILQYRLEGKIPEKDQIQGEIEVSAYATPWSWASFLGSLPASCRTVYGNPVLPEGYQLVIVPWDAVVHNYEDSPVEEPIFSNYGLLKTMFAIIQTLFAIVSLYEATGDQIHQLGYAAFGLTVAPYLLMSLVNVLSGVFCPEYPSLFLIESSVLLEARSRPGARLDATVGVLVEAGEDALKLTPSRSDKNLSLLGRPLVFQPEIIHPDGPDTSLPAQTTQGFAPDNIATGDSLQVPQTEVDGDQGSGENFKDQSERLIPAPEVKPPNHQKSYQIATVLPPQSHGHGALQAVLLPVGNDKSPTPEPTIVAYVPSCRPYITDSSLNFPDQYVVLDICRSESENIRNGGPSVSMGKAFEISKWPVAITRRATKNATLGPLAFILSYAIGFASLALIGGLTHFSRGSSTHAQRVWTMTWICFGCFLGPIYSAVYGESPFFYRNPDEPEAANKLERLGEQIGYKGGKIVLSFLLSAPAIGGFVVISQMMMVYGNCNRID